MISHLDFLFIFVRKEIWAHTQKLSLPPSESSPEENVT